MGWQAAVAIAFVTAVGAPAQVEVPEAGERLKVPSADKELFFLEQPVVVDGVILAPLAALERWLHTTAQQGEDGSITFAYYGETQTAVHMRLWLGQKRAEIGRLEVPLDAAPQQIGEVVFVPLRFVAEGVGVWVDAIDHRIRLKKPDLNWECWMAVPPHPQSLEGKLLALAVARNPTVPKRVEQVWLSADTMSGEAQIAQPSSQGGAPLRTIVRYSRNAKGWHFAAQEALP